MVYNTDECRGSRLAWRIFNHGELTHPVYILKARRVPNTRYKVLNMQKTCSESLDTLIGKTLLLCLSYDWSRHDFCACAIH